MAFVTLEDLTGSVEIIVFPEVYTTSIELLKGEDPLLVSGELDVGEEACKILATEVALLKDVKETLARRVHIRLTTPGLEEMKLRQLKGLIQRYRGNCEVQLHIVIPNRSETVITLPQQLRMAASDEAIADAEALFDFSVMSFE
jgi:DNA polymerase-3 subunit alpha